MRILHSSDWHLGRVLETYSRLPEQELFIAELDTICDEEEIDIILLTGDIFDTASPPAAAEELFYQSMKRLSKDGKRPIVVIAGNHDNPKRLTASSPLATNQGIILLGTLNTIIRTGVFQHFTIVKSANGLLELKIGNENIVLACIPYTSQKRLNMLISLDFNEEEYQKKYSDLIKEAYMSAEAHFNEDTINIAMGHFHIVSGLTCQSEREIQIGGIYSVEKDALPNKAQYVAMGHLHRPQTIHQANVPTFYSGSPLQYSISESKQDKFVNIIEALPNKEAKITKRKLTAHKPIELWSAQGMNHAIQLCNENQHRDSWVYLEIATDSPLTHSYIKEIHSIKKDVLKIIPVIKDRQSQQPHIMEEISKSIDREFEEFYEKQLNAKPTEELTQLFMEIWTQMENQTG